VKLNALLRVTAAEHTTWVLLGGRLLVSWQGAVDGDLGEFA
jgi:hypothetical protein